MFFITGVEFSVTFFLVEWSSSSSSSGLFVEWVGIFSWLSSEWLVILLLDWVTFSVESWGSGSWSSLDTIGATSSSSFTATSLWGLSWGSSGSGDTETIFG